MILKFHCNSKSKDNADNLGSGQNLLALLPMIVFAAIVVLISFAPTSIVAQDVGEKVFKEKNFPWYDANEDGVQRIELKERPGIKSSSRHTVPLKPIRSRNAKKNNFGRVNGTGAFLEGMGVIAWLLIGVVIAVVIAGLVWAFLRMSGEKSETENQVPRRSMAESIKQLPFDLDVQSGDFRLAAQKASAANDYRNAIIYLFSHVLVSLDQKNLIRLRKGKTNRQYLSELRGFRPLANFYQRVMVPFESTFFGDHDIQEQEFDSCWSRLDQFQQDVEQTTQVSNV